MLDALFEIMMTLRPFDSLLNLMALIVVTFLLSSPGVAGTVVGLGAKLGLLSFVKQRREEVAETPADA